MKGKVIMLTNSRNAEMSAMYIGYLIIAGIKNKNKEKVSIYDISNILRRKRINSSRQLVLGLSFLYSVGIVEFEEANIWIKK